MSTNRRNEIIKLLNHNSTPISASKLGSTFNVSRQVIVNDIALLRAEGSQIIATPRGYLIDNQVTPTYTIACRHKKEDLLDELTTIVECGCGIIDVVVEHDVYGQLSAILCIYCKDDIDLFLNKLNTSKDLPLCTITNDLHLHTLSCPTPQHFEKVKLALEAKGYLINNETTL